MEQQPVEKCAWTALEFVLWMKPAVPMSREHPCTPASNSEIRRWLDQKAVRINGAFPKAKEEITLPVTDLVFFPASNKSRTTVF